MHSQMTSHNQQFVLTALEITPNRMVHSSGHRRTNRSRQSYQSNCSNTKFGKLKNANQDKLLKEKERSLLREKKKMFSAAIRDKNVKKKSTPKESIVPSLQLPDMGASMKQQRRVSSENEPPQMQVFTEPKMSESEIVKPKPTQMQIRTRAKYLQNNFLKKHKGSLEENEYFSVKFNNVSKPEQQQGTGVSENDSSMVSCIVTRPSLGLDAGQNYCGVDKWAMSKSNICSYSSAMEDLQKQELYERARKTEEQLDRCKDYIGEMEDKVQNMLIWKSQFPNFVPVGQPGEDVDFSGQASSNKFVLDRLLSLEEEVFSLKNIKSSLELRVYAGERKIVEETEAIRRKCNKEIHLWRQRFDKIAIENSVLKGSLEDTFSMDISRDQ